MPTSTVLLIHVCAATVGLISGWLAIVLRKGSGLHRAAGTVFFISILIASSAGASVAAFMRPNSGNLMGSTLTFYLVATAWVAARRSERKVGIFDWSALLVALAIGAAGVTWGLEAASSQTGMKDKYPAGFYFVFGSVALLFATSDVRMLVRGGVSGSRRIARHLWRMCLALLFAMMSAYPGQARLFPTLWRKTNMLYMPHVLVIGLTIFWMVRVLYSNAHKTKQSLPGTAVPPPSAVGELIRT